MPGEAFIDPDEPIVRVADPDAEAAPISDDAFIDPDEPIVRTREPEKPADFEKVVGRASEGEDDDEIVVTGIGAGSRLDDPAFEGVARYGDEAVAELVEMVDTLAKALRSKGEAGLRGQSGMSRFEITLRAYCVGYLNGRREGTEEDEE